MRRRFLAGAFLVTLLAFGRVLPFAFTLRATRFVFALRATGLFAFALRLTGLFAFALRVTAAFVFAFTFAFAFFLAGAFFTFFTFFTVLFTAFTAVDTAFFNAVPALATVAAAGDAEGIDFVS